MKRKRNLPAKASVPGERLVHASSMPVDERLDPAHAGMTKRTVFRNPTRKWRKKHAEDREATRKERILANVAKQSER